MVWEFWVMLAGVIFTAGGLVTWIKVSHAHLHRLHEADMGRLNKTLESLESRVNVHEEHFARHDVVFENIAVNQKYIMQGIDELKAEMSDMRKQRLQELCED